MGNDFDLNGMSLLREMRDILKQIEINTRPKVSVPSVWTEPPAGYCDHWWETVSEVSGRRLQRCIKCGMEQELTYTVDGGAVDIVVKY